MADAQEFRLDQRVSLINAHTKGPHSGTVKFVGTLPTYEGSWIGVDWDNPKAGRHDGTLHGVSYFHTHSATSGSFVRPRNLSTGHSLLHALSLRYQSSAAPGQDDMYVMSVSQLRVSVELVGKAEVEERQRRLESLKVATLTYAGVCSAGPPGQLKDACPNINELDLTGNLLPDWHEVGRICKELLALRMLDLSCSRISLDSSNPLSILSNLTTLVLNNCALNWRQVELLKTSLPSIQELSLCNNNLQSIEVESGNATSVGAHVQGFASLRLLNLDANQFESWHEILKLSGLRSLEQLNLNGNKLHQIFYFKASSSSVGALRTNEKECSLMPFPSLRCLLLGQNQIADWHSIDALDQFPSLQELRLSDNPITDTANGSAPRYMIVARIGNLTSLNGSQVKPRERRDSEIRYVRHLLTNMQGNSMADVSKCHPRFESLRVSHDIPWDLQRGATGAIQKMSSSLFSVSIFCVADASGEKAPVVKKLPSSTTVGRLKVVCESLYKVKTSRQRLFYSEPESPLPVSLDNDMETLADIGFVLGASILVDELQD